MMKKFTLVMSIMLVAGSVFGSDVVLNVTLFGSEIEEGYKVSRVFERGLLVIEDFCVETNVHNGTFYLVTGRTKGNWKKQTYVTEEVLVRIITNKHKQFGMIVEFDSAILAGIGRATKNHHGDYSQIIISSGHGIFLHAGFDTESETNAVPFDGVSSNVVSHTDADDVMVELETGRMHARLNKRLTDAAKEYTGDEVVAHWLETAVFMKTPPGHLKKEK